MSSQCLAADLDYEIEEIRTDTIHLPDGFIARAVLYIPSSQYDNYKEIDNYLTEGIDKAIEDGIVQIYDIYPIEVMSVLSKLDQKFLIRDILEQNDYQLEWHEDT